jgi:ATP-dependent Clp protease protease subunit
MKKFLVALAVTVVSLFLFNLAEASESVKANLKGTNKVKYYTLKIDSARAVVMKGVIKTDNTDALKKQIISFKEADGKLPIFIVLNSPGGSIVAGFEFITLIKSIPNPTYCVIESEAFSMAAIISQYCTHTYIHKYGGIMFHEAAYGVDGSVSQVNSRVTFINNYIKSLEDDLALQMGITYTEYKDLTAKEWWVTATQAVQYGLADGIVNKLYYTALPPEKKFSIFEFNFNEDGNVIEHPAR